VKSFGVLESAAPEGTCIVNVMNTKPARDLEDAIAEMDLTRRTLAKVEDDWKFWRASSKQITLELVTVHGVSVAKASLLSGHTRQTIKIWLDVWNAERKEPKK
jgi:hypothetical protein